MIELERDRVGMMSVSRSRSDQAKAVASLTDSFWISVDSESDRRNSISRKDSYCKTKCDRDVKESEKHWQLQRRVSDLNAQSAQLEKRITALKEENDILKKKTEEQKFSEEKAKKLKRRNAELASIARKLEEKVKQIQHDSPKKTMSSSPGIETNSPKQTASRTKTRTREVDKVKDSPDKDRVIALMRERFQELLRQHRSIQENDLMNKELYTDHLELENIIRVAAKERLQLEKQLVDEQHNPEIEAQLTKAAHLEQRNAELMDEVERLTKFADDREKLEIEVVQRRIEVEMLEKQIAESEKQQARLAEELQDLMTKNTQLAIINTDIERQIEELDQMAKNYDSLSASLAAAEGESQRAKAEASALRSRIQTLEAELQLLEQVEKKKRQLELEKQSLLETVRIKEQEMDAVTKERQNDTLRHEQSLNKLELKLVEMEGLYKDQLKINETLGKELKDLHEVLRKNLSKGVANTAEVQTAGSHSKLKMEETELTYSSNRSQIADPLPNDLPVIVGSRTQPLKNVNRSTAEGTRQNAAPVENGCANTKTLNEEDLVERGDKSIIQVFQAVFDYDPDQCSPNEEPEAELLLAMGDYMFVYDNMDEDGFYFAELLDGRRGLVPSNFVRRLSEEELVRFYSDINMDLQGNGASIHGQGTQHSLDFSCHEDADVSDVTNAQNFSSPTHTDADKSMEVSFSNDILDLRQQAMPGVPDAPLNVQVESGPDHGCMMISWLPVTITADGTSNGTRVAGYSIFIDGQKVKWLPNPTGDHVLLEAEDLPRSVEPRCVTVRTLSTSGVSSVDSLPAFISPHLLHELQTDNTCLFNRYDELGTHDEGLDKDSDKYSSVKQISNSDVEVNLETDSENRSHEGEDFQAKEGIENDAENDQPRQEAVGHSSSSAINACTTVMPQQKQNSLQSVPASSGAKPGLCHDDADVALRGAYRSSVWKKVGVEERLNATFDATDLVSANLDLNDRTWKSLNAGNALIGKTQSQEVLGGSKRSDTLRYLSQADVNARTGHLEVSPLENGVENKAEESRSSGKESNRRIHSFTASLTDCDDNLNEYVDDDDDGLGASIPHGYSLTRTVSMVDHVDSAFSEFASSAGDHCSSHNGVVTNEIDENISSSSELINNNIVTSKKIRDDIPDSDLIDYSDDGGESLVESVDCDRDVPVRIFIALFSYDPAMMSPNPDAVTEELPFREGQIIKIYGEKDQDGFFLGEINHQRGLVPCNMISEVHINDPDIAAQLLEESHQPNSHSATNSRTSSRTSDFTSRTHSTISMMGVPDDERDSPVGEQDPDHPSERYVIALYHYDPDELSPNADVDEELSFQKGDIIKVLGEVDEDGFYYGQLNDRCGLVPSNFVKEAPSSAVYYAAAMQNR